MIARWFWREWRSPSLIIVWLALSLAVASLRTGARQYQRPDGKVKSAKAAGFMAGDRTLQEVRGRCEGAAARKRGLNVGEQLTFATMTFAGDTPQLASVKAVIAFIRCTAYCKPVLTGAETATG